MMKSKPSVGRRGFTLIELMIVVAIIGILAAVAIPKFAEMIRKSKEGATKGSLSALRSALTIYMSDNEGLAPTQRTESPAAAVDLEAAMLTKYIESIPTAKLGEYHADTNLVTVALLPATYDGNRSSHTTDVNGWIFASAGGALFWTNCSHTDTKNEGISGW